jgi:sugar phosphate isomerase/epimerase
MNIRDRIGLDIGRRSSIEEGIKAAIEHSVRYLDLKIDVPPNSVETLTDERVAAIKQACQENGIHVGIHTLSAVNVAEVAPHVREGVDRYLFGHLEACKRIGGEWMVVHGGFHFTSDLAMRRDAAVERLSRLCRRAEELGVDILFENMNKEPPDAEVRYLGFNVEETQYFFDRLKSPRLRWAFTANHAHLVPEGIEGFIKAFDLARCDEVRLADCWRNGKEIHLKPGDGDLDFADLFRRLEGGGFKGHYMTAFGSLSDMIAGRERLAQIAANGKA